MAHAPLPISRISRTLNITPRAIRFYEERDLVKSCRNRMNQRCFDELAQARLSLLVKFRAADLGLDEIGRLLDLYEREGDSCVFRDRVSRALAAKAAGLEDKLALTNGLLSEFSVTAKSRAA